MRTSWIRWLWFIAMDMRERYLFMHKIKRICFLWASRGTAESIHFKLTTLSTRVHVQMKCLHGRCVHRHCYGMFVNVLLGDIFDIIKSWYNLRMRYIILHTKPIYFVMTWKWIIYCICLLGYSSAKLYTGQLTWLYKFNYNYLGLQKCSFE